jgi:signal peptidase II
MGKLQRLLVLLCVLFVSVGCDQATKAVARTHLSEAPPIVLLNGIIRLQYAENPGAFLSFGADFGNFTRYWLFTPIAALILLGLLLFVIRQAQQGPLSLVVAFALFLGGGVGNLIDRITNDGRVIDFMNVGFGGLRTGIFNVADMALMAGLFLLTLTSFAPTHPEQAAKPDSV